MRGAAILNDGRTIYECFFSRFQVPLRLVAQAAAYQAATYLVKKANLPCV